MFTTRLYRRLITVIAVLIGIFSYPAIAHAHPLGNFTINHFAQLHIDANQVTVQYVVDMAEIPTFQALQIADSNGDRTPTSAELQAYLAKITPQYTVGLDLKVDHQPVALTLQTQAISLPPGTGGLATMRLEWTLTGKLSALNQSPHTLDFANNNDPTRIGWREVIADPTSLSIFNSSVYSNSLTNALRAYPDDLLSTPLQESTAHLSFTSGELPAEATPLLTRSGQATPQHNLWTALNAWQALLFNRNYQRPILPQLDGSSTGGIVMAIVAAFVWGALHSLSPGHGKTLVGAYLIGTKATPQHALLLALTTTITHTIGVFALGFITLFAAGYILPEQLYPWLSLGSGLMVVAIGGNLCLQRWRSFHFAAKTMPTPESASQLADSPDHGQAQPEFGFHSHHDHDARSHPLHESDSGLAIAALPALHLSGHHPHDHVHADGSVHLRDHSHLLTQPVTHNHKSHQSHQDLTHQELTHHHTQQHHHHHHDHGHHHHHDHNHDHNHHHDHVHDHDHYHNHGHNGHTHLPGADGAPVTWQSLIALGISGGLMPCPAALVLLLGAIALNQTSFGLILVFVFSLGLVGVLTGLGLLLVYAKHLFQAMPISFPWLKGLPMVGAFGMALIGLGISTQALLTLTINHY
jgi:nickel/cobalt transporter (NicO) family protein